MANRRCNWAHGPARQMGRVPSTWTARGPSFRAATCMSSQRDTELGQTVTSACNSVNSSIRQQLMSALGAALILATSPGPSQAVLNSPNAQIPRSVEAALRRSIPTFNSDVKDIKKALEDTAYLMRIPQRKPYPTMARGVQSALLKFERRESLLEGVPADKAQEAAAAVETLYTSLLKLQNAVLSAQPDYVSKRVAEALKAVASLELLEAPGLPFDIKKEYANLPRLAGRAVVTLTVERRDGALSFIDKVNGGLTSMADVQLTLDGYSAPISAGNFLLNVMNGRYNGREFGANGTAVLVSTPPNVEAGQIPLEIMPLDAYEPIYRLPLDVQSGELPVLPLSINGAVSMGHVIGNDSFLDGDAWFIYKFDNRVMAGLSGLAFDEGTFGVMGYVTEGMDTVASLRPGDIIKSVQVVSGADRLIQPTRAT